jgi:hypothetical protein
MKNTFLLTRMRACPKWPRIMAFTELQNSHQVRERLVEEEEVINLEQERQKEPTIKGGRGLAVLVTVQQNL